MIVRLRALWEAINASYWFYPALFALGAVLVSSTTIWFDRNGAAEILSRVDWLTPSRPQGARALLSLIAASMIGVAATVFSITIAAVAYASGTYGPRLLTNFMEDRGNQLSLAVFIATFVHALLVLRVVRGEDEEAISLGGAVGTSTPGFVPQLSILVAFGLTMISVVVLVYLLHHIPSSIRINKVIEQIGCRLIASIKGRFPKSGDAEHVQEPINGTPVIAADHGYITLIDFATLDAIAEKHGAVVSLPLRTGDFVHGAVTLLHWRGPDLDDETEEKLRGCFAIGSSRSPHQDIDYMIDELVEIALRALSPGINDPFTAIAALDWLGAATAELSRRSLDRGPEQDDYDRTRVKPVADGFNHYLERGFGSALRSVASSDVAAAKFIGIVESMLPAAANAERRAMLLALVDRLLALAEIALERPAFVRLESRCSILPAV